MKNFVIKLVWLTTIYAIAFAGLCQTSVSINFLMILLILGFCLVLIMVYIVFTDKYKTSKNFKDWYSDHVIKNLEQEE